MFIRSFFFASPAFALVLAASNAFAQEPAPAQASAPQPAPIAQPAAVAQPAAAPVTETVPEAAPEAPRQHFGDAGHFALAINHGFAVNTTDLYTGADELQFSYFPASHVSLSLALGAQYISQSPPNNGESTHSLILHVGPRIGYDVRISDAVSFWPQAGIDYRQYDETVSSSSSSSGTTTATETYSSVGVTVLAPFVVHPTQGFFVGAGPAFYADLVSSRSIEGNSSDQKKTTALGLVATLGGAF